MANASQGCRAYRFPDGLQIDGLELSALAGAGVSDSNEMNEGVSQSDLRSVTLAIEGVADHRFATRRDLAFRARSHQRPHPMAPTQQFGSEGAPNETTSSREKHVSWHMC